MTPSGRAAAGAFFVLIGSTPAAAQLAPPRDAIRAEVREFYRDDRANRWPDVLGHFWVGKISARWIVPTSDPAWLRARPGPADSACAPGQDQALALTIVVIADRWARVFVTRCGWGSADELWMLRVGEEWRIARLIRGS